jgi:hypothetical protein
VAIVAGCICIHKPTLVLWSEASHAPAMGALKDDGELTNIKKRQSEILILINYSSLSCLKYEYIRDGTNFNNLSLL